MSQNVRHARRLCEKTFNLLTCHWKKMLLVAFLTHLVLVLQLYRIPYEQDHRNFLFENASELLSFKGDGLRQATNEISPRIRPISTDKFHGIHIVTNGSFIDRVQQFNIELNVIRAHILVGLVVNGSFGDWDDTVIREQTKPGFIWGGRDDYLELLAKQHRHILTIAMPWLPAVSEHATRTPDSTESSTNNVRWNSLHDKSNVLVQQYYVWTGDDNLCTLIETPGAIKMKYDSVFNRTCERNQSSSAAVPQSLEPLFLNTKPIYKPQYWPNDGNAFPTWFYTDPPPFVFHLHVHQDAVVDDGGDVFSGGSALALYLCRDPYGEPHASLPNHAASLPLYDEVFTLTQMWGTAVFHRMVEVMPRIVVFVDFLLANPDIKIQAPGAGDTRFYELLSFFGLDRKRVVYGAARAKIVYQPRPTGCGVANVQESQLTSKYYRDHISRTVPANQRRRNRLVLIRRSGSRRFTEQQEIESRIQSVATDFGLKYELFADNPTPSLADTMTMFNAAVMVVGPHGAGLSNIMFSEPGTFVVEGVCNIPHVNLCFQRLAHILGHRWHGVTSRRGCEGVVDVSAASIDAAARTFLNIWNATEPILLQQ